VAGMAGTRAQLCDRYGSGKLHLGQDLGGSLQLLSPTYVIMLLEMSQKGRHTECQN